MLANVLLAVLAASGYTGGCVGGAGAGAGGCDGAGGLLGLHRSLFGAWGLLGCECGFSCGCGL